MYGYSQSQRLFLAPSRWHDTRKWYPKAIRTFLQQLCALGTRQESASTEPTGTVTDIDVTRVTAIDFLPSSLADDDACTVVVWYAASAESGSRICYVARLRSGSAIVDAQLLLSRIALHDTGTGARFAPRAVGLLRTGRLRHGGHRRAA